MTDIPPGRSRPLVAPSPPEPREVEGTLEALDELEAMDNSNRIGRTLQQVAPVSAIVGLIGYGLTFSDIDFAPLDPDSKSVPEWVVGLVVTIGTWLTARRMNRPPSPPS